MLVLPCDLFTDLYDSFAPKPYGQLLLYCKIIKYVTFSVACKVENAVDCRQVLGIHIFHLVIGNFLMILYTYCKQPIS